MSHRSGKSEAERSRTRKDKGKGRAALSGGPEGAEQSPSPVKRRRQDLTAETPDIADLSPTTEEEPAAITATTSKPRRRHLLAAAIAKVNRGQVSSLFYIQDDKENAANIIQDPRFPLYALPREDLDVIAPRILPALNLQGIAPVGKKVAVAVDKEADKSFEEAFAMLTAQVNSQAKAIADLRAQNEKDYAALRVQNEKDNAALRVQNKKLAKKLSKLQADLEAHLAAASKAKSHAVKLKKHATCITTLLVDEPEQTSA
eukprot:TRINITY_DN11002_c0_g1_i1.p1 TRINITY_DN11002_c0_g1~~TRINITY_DN11002_c0_g1_i1.p1  ORF type:complete len:259 (-),score=57.06 TRINITY_DN11002_c0_g1_i1:157-933(-)